MFEKSRPNMHFGLAACSPNGHFSVFATPQLFIDDSDREKPDFMSPEPSLRSTIVIPARLASTRLPRKLLLRETGQPPIQHNHKQRVQATKHNRAHTHSR